MCQLRDDPTTLQDASQKPRSPCQGAKEKSALSFFSTEPGHAFIPLHSDRAGEHRPAERGVPLLEVH